VDVVLVLSRMIPQVIEEISHLPVISIVLQLALCFMTDLTDNIFSAVTALELFTYPHSINQHLLTYSLSVFLQLS